MGYHIVVDHSVLGRTAKVIEEYNANADSQMKKANEHAHAVASSWGGTDEREFLRKWDTLDNVDSTYRKMKSSLENYAKYLRSAEAKYKDAQAQAISKASKLLTL